MNGDPLTLSTRINRIFGTFHARHEDEQTDAQVARSLSARLARIVPSQVVTELRAGGQDHLTAENRADSAVLAALADHFEVPPAYLLEDGIIPEAIDRELRLLAAARDAGMKSLALRGSAPDQDALRRELKRLAQTPPGQQ